MIERLIASGLVDKYDFATLQGDDEYTRYFQLLSRVFTRLSTFYRAQTEFNDVETNEIEGYLARYLATIEMLRIKYAYPGATARPLWIDLSESGFPNFMEFRNLETDLEIRKERLRLLPPAALLKGKILDHLMIEHVDPLGIVSTYAEFLYFNMLAPERVFLPFVPGAILPCIAKARTYLVSWGSVDVTTNRPFVTFMQFEQDADEPPLEEEGVHRTQFMECIRAEGSGGSGVSPLRVSAAAIDQAMETIHPKIVKRICLGPLYTPLLLERVGGENPDAHAQILKTLFARYRQGEEDFILFFTHELLFSRRQYTKRGLMGGRGRTYEIFDVPEANALCYERQASIVLESVMLPHHLLQNISEDDIRTIPELGKRTRKVAYNEKGAVYEI